MDDCEKKYEAALAVIEKCREVSGCGEHELLLDRLEYLAKRDGVLKEVTNDVRRIAQRIVKVSVVKPKVDDPEDCGA